MATLGEYLTGLAKTIKASPRTSPSTITVPRDHIDENRNGALDPAFRKGQDYFQVLINEMYLANEREWFSKIDPVVYAVSEFTYNAKPEQVPCLIGPGLLKKKGIPDEIAKGVIIRNVSVSDLRPYRGGGLTLSVVLCRSNSENVLRPLLKVVENVAQALDFSPVLAPYTKIADAVMSGFESLFNTGCVVPLVGLQDSYGPVFNISFRPSYFALVDTPDVDPKTLWVCNKQLYQGPDWDHLKPYRQGDYVLYSFVRPENGERDDTDNLPFNDLWEQISKEAASPKDDPDYASAKTQMAALYQMMVQSPDLTETQADALADRYAQRMKAIHEKAKSFGAMAAPEGESEEQARLDRARRKALEILNW